MKYVIIIAIVVVLLIPINAYADDFTIQSECDNGSWKATIFSDEGNPLPNVNVRTIKSLSTSSFESKFLTDENGKVEIPPEENTGFIWLSKGGYNDKKIGIQCEVNSQPTIEYSNLGKTDVDKMTVEIVSIEPFGQNKWKILWDACALDDQVGPLYRFNSDIDWSVFGVNFRMYTGQCLYEYFGHHITSIVKAENPESIEITLADYGKAESEPYAYVMEVLETKFPDRYIAFFKVCAGEQKLTSPELKITSDISEVPSALSMTVLNPKSCVDHDVQIDAKDKRSIQIDIVTARSAVIQISDNEVTLLKSQLVEKENQILELKEQLENKDEIIMEQVKVLLELASNIKKTIFEPISKFFGFA